MNHFVGVYSGTKPEFVDNDSFRVVITLNDDSTQDERMQVVLDYCKNPRSMQEIVTKLGLNSVKYVRRTIIKPLIKSRQLSMTLPD